MSQTSPIPRFPQLAAQLLAPLPPLPLSLLLGHAMGATAAAHADQLARLGPHAEKRFLVDPTDLPFSFLVRPRLAGPQIEVLGRSSAPYWDCRIAGPLAALLGMMHGTYDGDALFFSRDIVIEGDTAAALAFRNALDDAEIDLLDEVVRRLGPAGQALGPGLRTLARVAGRITGVALTRQAAHR